MHWDSWNGIRKEGERGEGRRQKARKEGRKEEKMWLRIPGF